MVCWQRRLCSDPEFRKANLVCARCRSVVFDSGRQTSRCTWTSRFPAFALVQKISSLKRKAVEPRRTFQENTTVQYKTRFVNSLYSLCFKLKTLSVTSSVVELSVRGWEIESHVSVRASEPTDRGREIIFNLLTVYNTIIHCFSVKFMFFGVSIYRN